MTIEELLEKIRRTKEEIRLAGPIHRRDLQKHLKRLRIQVLRMARDQKEAV